MRLSIRARIVLLVLLAVVVAAAFSVVPRFAQPLSYHHFADQRAWLGVANFGDVASNLPFAALGLWGLAFLASPRSAAQFIDARERWPYCVAFLGILLTAFGSSYYHLNPNNARLVWDRLPIMLAFTATAAALITERVHIRLGLLLLPLLVATGMASVGQWYASEVHGSGDLRFYAAVQVWCTLVLLLVLLFPARYTRGSDVAVVVALYALAKALEALDKPIFQLGHIVSGHTLKHLVAGAAGYWLLRMLRKRQPISP